MDLAEPVHALAAAAAGRSYFHRSDLEGRSGGRLAEGGPSRKEQYTYANRGAQHRDLL